MMNTLFSYPQSTEDFQNGHLSEIVRKLADLGFEREQDLAQTLHQLTEENHVKEFWHTMLDVKLVSVQVNIASNFKI